MNPTLFSYSVLSFVELGKQLLTEPGVEYLLSKKFNQDQLEQYQYFSKQRGTGGSCENPTVEQFWHDMFAFHVASSASKASKKGNVGHKSYDSTVNIDSAPVPKRSKMQL